MPRWTLLSVLLVGSVALSGCYSSSYESNDPCDNGGCNVNIDISHWDIFWPFYLMFFGGIMVAVIFVVASKQRQEAQQHPPQLDDEPEQP